MQIGERIKEERERLGFNQTDFAALASATRKTLFNWESGTAAPSATALAAWAIHGVDVLYVITGRRIEEATAQAQILPPRKAALLSNYENSDEEGRKIIEGAADLAAKSNINPNGKAA